MKFVEIFDGKKEIREASMSLGIALSFIMVFLLPPHTEVVVGVVLPFISVASVEIFFRLIEWMNSKLQVTVI